MLNQLNQLKTIGGAERINFSIQFLPSNKARVVLTSQVDTKATGELADLLRTPIVLTGSLSDIDTMLTNELFNLADQVEQVPTCTTATPSPDIPTETVVTDIPLDENFEDDDESL
ncbi:hypothetical protein [Shewanella algicola]|uniref:hypothetical protein n=1 Tax=Shewanella algicola TaxID=640633 RepID=UPI002494D975|nr:hypothetical protein [Shewanella algicola]